MFSNSCLNDRNSDNRETIAMKIFSELFNEIYMKDNYLIEYDHRKSENICAIYFSSSDIYYPTTEEQFKRAFVENNRFEWYKNRIPTARKHIFLRDIAKKFYAYGISSSHADLTSVLLFLKEQTEGFRVVTVGSSSGGYAAALFGVLLKAELVYCFSGYFNLKILNREKWPDVCSNEIQSRLSEYACYLPEHPNSPTDVFYVYPIMCTEDKMQAKTVENNVYVHSIAIKNSIHGVCIGGFNLKKLFATNKEELLRLFSDGKPKTLLSFTIRLEGGHRLACLKKVSAFGISRLMSRIKNRLGYEKRKR